MLIEFPFPLAGRGQGRGASAMKAVNGSFTHPPPLPSREGSFLYDMEPLMKNSNKVARKGRNRAKSNFGRGGAWKSPTLAPDI